MKRKSAANDSQRRREVVRHFKLCAARGTLIGNYFVELSAVGDRSLCRYLRELRASNSDDVESDWLDLLCAWFEDGASALAALATSNRRRSMCLSILGENRSTESLAAMARILPLQFRLPHSPRACETQSGWATDVGRALGNGPRLELDRTTQRRLYRFTGLLISKGVAKVERQMKKERSAQARGQCASAGDLFYIIPALHLLKFIGMRESIGLIRGLPDWSAAGRDLGPRVIRTIQERQQHFQ